MDRLYIIAGALILAVLCGLGAGYYGFQLGQADRQAAWDKQKHLDDDENKKNRLEGFRVAEKLQEQLDQLRGNYDALALQRATSLDTKLKCPATGRAGDLVIPAAIVRSMFNITDKPGATIGSPSAGAASAVRDGVAHTRRRPASVPGN